MITIRHILLTTKNIIIPLLIILGLVACSDSNEDKIARDNSVNKISIPDVNVSILAHSCEPMEMTIKSGKTRFIIHNKSDKSVEWEILKGIRIIDERENILPGFTRKMTSTLDPGVYEITCGLLSNPKGKLIVELAEGAEKYPKPTPLELVAAIAEYKVYTITEIKQLLKVTKKLAAAIAAADLNNAKLFYAPAMQHYEHIEPFIKQFSNIEQAIAADENLYAEKDKNPNFSGFHKLEKGLFEHATTAELEIVANQLIEDIAKLEVLAAKAKITAIQLVNFSIALMREVQSGKLTGTRQPYAHTEISGIYANTDGSYRIFRLLRPMLAKSNPELKLQIEQQYKSILTQIEKQKTQGIFNTYNQLNETDKQRLIKDVTSLLAMLEKLPQALGIE